MTHIPLTPEQIKQVEQAAVQRLAEKRNKAVQRFPLLFTMLGTFGLVATFYGFEHIIDDIDFLANNPVILLLVGVTTLIVTGSLYKKLG